MYCTVCCWGYIVDGVGFWLVWFGLVWRGEKGGEGIMGEEEDDGRRVEGEEMYGGIVALFLAVVSPRQLDTWGRFDCLNLLRWY